MGRPSKYSKALVVRLCSHIAGGKSLKSFCDKKDNPSMQTIYAWLADKEDFSEMYARAKQDQGDSLADEIIDIADTEPDPQRAKVRIDARKWTASKLRPQKYGDKVELGGKGGGAIPVQVISGVPRGDSTDD